MSTLTTGAFRVAFQLQKGFLFSFFSALERQKHLSTLATEALKP